jgi:uncharacterized protein YecE (DUF72 family)
MSRTFIGTSGWSYDGWRGLFYPEGVPKKQWLGWYATQFSDDRNQRLVLPHAFA